MSIFLDQADLAILTGKKLKSGQVAALRKMGILFYVNAAGRAVVPKASLFGQSPEPEEKPWQPAVLRNHG